MQVEIIKDLPEDKAITVYRCGPLVDLCRGPHIPNTSFAKALKCLKVMELTPLSCAFNYFSREPVTNTSMVESTGFLLLLEGEIRP